MIIRRIKVFLFLIYLDCSCLFVVPGAVGRMNRLNHEAHQQSLAKFAPLPLCPSLRTHWSLAAPLTGHVCMCAA